MSDKKQIAARRSSALFGRENYKWMLIGLVVIVIGVLLMIGGKSPDPNQFRRGFSNRHTARMRFAAPG